MRRSAHPDSLLLFNRWLNFLRNILGTLLLLYHSLATRAPRLLLPVAVHAVYLPILSRAAPLVNLLNNASAVWISTPAPMEI
ncbi:hypothetical protein BJ912DRAFT_965779, partial [Pholiota molesta]